MAIINIGAVGVTGCALITIFAEAKEVHPVALVTVYVYVPAVNPEIVYDVPEPAIAPGLRIHVPAGKPFNITLPVATEQVGWVIVPAIGAFGTALMVIIAFPTILILQEVETMVASTV
jgi:hypothetical protein